MSGGGDLRERMGAKILVTGATGYIGQALCKELSARGFELFVVVRPNQMLDICAQSVVMDDINAATQWGAAFQGVDAVIHLAGRAHVLKEGQADPLAEFRRINTEGTIHLAKSAAVAGVKRFVFVSSIGVNGKATNGRSFLESDVAKPHNEYALSKWEAEQALHEIALETGIELVVVRPPLVYGPNAPGNFGTMARTLLKGIPLPLASVKNQRSLIYLGNFIDALAVCSTHPTAKGQTYLVSDGEDISTPELLRQLGAAMGRTARLWPFPPKLLARLAEVAGKSDQVQRLMGSLQIDSGKIRRELNWTPPFTLQQGLQATAEWYRDKYL